MLRLISCILLVLSFVGCSHFQPAATSRRVSLAKDNISFILPDSSLTRSKPKLWPSDYPGGDYGETGAFYCNHDSSVILSVYVTAIPNPLQRTLQWHMINNEQKRRNDLFQKNRGIVAIERYTADSATGAIDIDYRFPERLGRGWQNRASFNKSLIMYGPQRTIEFWFSAPDDAAHRQAIATARASVRVDSSYLHGIVNPWPQREYQD